MKKFLVSLLCVVMVICMAGIAMAAEVKTDRSIEVSASDAVVFAGDTVEITVAIHGDDLVNAEWSLSYNPDYFTYEGATSDIGATSVANGSTIKAHHFITDKDVVYTDGQALAVYKFTAKAQADVVYGDFAISGTYAYTYMESIRPEDVFTASNNEKVTVKIDLIPYDVEKIFGNDTTTFEHDGEQVEVPYNDAEHYFQVKAYDSRDGEESTGAVITYKLVSFSEYNPDEASLLTDLVVGEEVTSIDDLKKQGTYVIEYYVSPEIGYAALTGDFTVNIVRPEFEIEVDLTEAGDYVNGKKIVLVYTDTDNVYFEFDGNTMLDVTASGYKFEDTTYYHVFAFVTDAIDGGTIDDYAALIKNIYDNSDVVTVEYTDSTDLNLDGDVTIRDVSVAYGVYNQVDEYYADAQWQRNILKADITHSKNVDNDDITLVIGDAFMN